MGLHFGAPAARYFRVYWLMNRCVVKLVQLEHLFSIMWQRNIIKNSSLLRDIWQQSMRGTCERNSRMCWISLHR